MKTKRHAALVEQLRAARLAAELRQSDAAERCGRSQQWLANIETGERGLDVMDFLMLADVIGFDASKIVARVAKIKG
jgi:transcriptional regulator with XRE-family HTH domain